MLVEMSCPGYSWVTKTQVAGSMQITHLPVGMLDGLECERLEGKPPMHHLHL